jgi:hypothetical protein
MASEYLDFDYAEVENEVILSLTDPALQQKLRGIQRRADAATRRHDSVSMVLPGVPYTLRTNFQELRN